MSIDPSIINDLTATSGDVAKWENIGDTHKVRIATATKQQVTNFATGEPETWGNGEPKWQLVFSGVNPDTGEDTRIFAKGFMYTAVKKCFAAAGQVPEVGGVLAIQWTGEEPAKVKGYNPSKTWRAQYAPPAISVNADDLI